MYSVLIGLPKSVQVRHAPNLCKGHRKHGRDPIANYTDEATDVAYSPILAVMVVHVSLIADLVVAFPLLLLVASSPCVIGEELVLVHHRIGNIIEIEPGKMSPQAIVGVVAEDKQVLVWQSNLLNYLTTDERTLEVAAYNGNSFVPLRLNRMLIILK